MPRPPKAAGLKDNRRGRESPFFVYVIRRKALKWWRYPFAQKTFSFFHLTFIHLSGSAFCLARGWIADGHIEGRLLTFSFGSSKLRKVWNKLSSKRDATVDARVGYAWMHCTTCLAYARCGCECFIHISRVGFRVAQSYDSGQCEGLEEWERVTDSHVFHFYKTNIRNGESPNKDQRRWLKISRRKTKL